MCLWLKEVLFPPLLLLLRTEDRLKKKMQSTLRSLDHIKMNLAGKDTENGDDSPSLAWPRPPSCLLPPEERVWLHETKTLQEP